MKPFIPNFIPSIGEVDAFLKINRPDNHLEELGLSCIDEPTINGVDPVIFSLDLSYTGKNNNINPNLIIKTLDNAEKKPKEIQSWIDSISDLHQKKMSSNVSYSKNMPDVESLMQVWPDKMENLLKDIDFPDGSIAMPLDGYAKIICNMLDVPLHKLSEERSIIEALHLIFSVYYEFKENQHFPRGHATGEIKSKNVQSMKFD
jgi:intraflagellar transport protein 46